MKFKVWGTRDVRSERIFLWETDENPDIKDGIWGEQKNFLISLTEKNFSRLTGVKLRPGEKKPIEIEVRETKVRCTPCLSGQINGRRLTRITLKPSGGRTIIILIVLPLRHNRGLQSAGCANLKYDLFNKNTRPTPSIMGKRSSLYLLW